MKIDIEDAALTAPDNDNDENRDIFAAWHWFWAKVFGERVPTSGSRAHIGNLLVTYRPGHSLAEFQGRIATDARHVIKIGDLWVYDYGDTLVESYHPEVMAYDPRDNSKETKRNAELLADNKRTYPQPHRSSA